MSFRLIKHGDKSFYLSLKREPACYRISITDLEKIWQTTISDDSLIESYRKENPLAPSSDDLVLNDVSNLFDTGEIHVSVDSESVSVLFETNNARFVVKLDLTLDPDERFNLLTLPLLMLVNELRHREENLISIIKAKDTHIREFELEGASISRANVITEPFVLQKFNDKCEDSVRHRASSIAHVPSNALTPSLLHTLETLSSVLKVKGAPVDPCLNEQKTTVEKKTVVDMSNRVDEQSKKKTIEALTRPKRLKKSYKI